MTILLRKTAKMCLLHPKCKCSLKLSLVLFLVLYIGLLTHKVLDATVETQGLGPPSEKMYNFFHFIKKKQEI